MSLIYVLVGFMLIPVLSCVYLCVYFYLEDKLPAWLAGVIAISVTSVALLLTSGCAVAIIHLLLYGKIII